MDIYNALMKALLEGRGQDVAEHEQMMGLVGPLTGQATSGFNAYGTAAKGTNWNP
jgi:hypothetical protein